MPDMKELNGANCGDGEGLIRSSIPLQFAWYVVVGGLSF